MTDEMAITADADGVEPSEIARPRLVKWGVAVERKRAIVVGGSGNSIGAAIAELLESQGHYVVRMQRRAVDGKRCHELDLRWETRRIQAAFAATADELGGLDWLVIAGGVGAYMRPLYGVKQVEDWAWQVEEQVSTNLIGPFACLESAAPLMQRDLTEPAARVLLLGSTMWRNPRDPALAIYAGAKAAVEVAFRARAMQWARRNVLVNTLAIGWAESDLTAKIEPAKLERIQRAPAMGRMAERAEIAEAALLALRMPYSAGDTITVSGGL